MSDAYTWAIRQRVGHGGRKSVLLFMATHATFNSAIADMSSEQIADVLEYSDSSIRKWLTELTEMGLVEKLPQYRSDGWQLANLYRLKVKGQWVMPESDPEEEELESEPEPQPKKKAGSRSLEQQCLEVYLELRAPNWVEHRSVTGRMRSQIKKLYEHFGDKTLEAFRHALLYAKQQDFWTNPKNTFSLTNIGSNDKLIDMAEKYEMALQQQKERLFSGGLTTGKVKEIIAKYPAQEITAEMWSLLPDDDKADLIEPGQTRMHEQLGRVLIEGVQGIMVTCRRGGETYREHVRHFTHEEFSVGEAKITVTEPSTLKKPMFGNDLVKRLNKLQKQ